MTFIPIFVLDQEQNGEVDIGKCQNEFAGFNGFRKLFTNQVDFENKSMLNTCSQRVLKNY